MAPPDERWSPRRWFDRARQNGGVGAVTALVMGVLVVVTYVLVVPVGGVVVGQPGPPDVWLSVLATAIVALGFEPVRRRVSPAVAGVLGRDRRTPQEILAQFGSSVTGRYPTEQIPGRMAKALAEGTGAVRAEVWLLVQGELSLAAQWPPAAGVPSGTATTERQVQHSLDVQESGELLGRFTVALAAGQELTPVEERLFAGLAAQSGLVLRAAGLRADLRRQLDQLELRTSELRRARRELVGRQDAERQRLERNIHDGAQQQVLALLVNLRLAQTVSSRSPERAGAVLAAQADAARAAIHTLTVLSQGLFPPVLTEAGPVAALETAVRSAPIPVRIEAANLRRFPAPLEAGLYFSCLEAVQNATKHSQASMVSIVIAESAEQVRFVVTDDGSGFGPGATTGSGLAGIRDRIESLDGVVTVDSGPSGTTVSAAIPTRVAVAAAT